jgi:ribosomal-protein-alanine N-acetyltransferase
MFTASRLSATQTGNRPLNILRRIPMSRLSTEHLELIALNTTQLILYVEQPGQLEAELGFLISRSVITDRVRRAIKMKLAKMENVGEKRKYWLTYWLIIIRDIPFGAGLIGFKGFPNENGEVEIGYGIDPEYQSRGYVTEAVKEMMKWAFREKACQSIVALGVQKTNIPSRRVLEKVGMTIVEETNETFSYKVTRKGII